MQPFGQMLNAVNLEEKGADQKIPAARKGPGAEDEQDGEIFFSCISKGALIAL